MDVRIADTFTDSLSRLMGDERKAVKMTDFEPQLSPANPCFSFHKLDKSKNRNFWSVRVNSDLRLIVHRAQGSLLLCYVGFHAQQCGEKYLKALLVFHRIDFPSPSLLLGDIRHETPWPAGLRLIKEICTMSFHFS